MPIKSLFRINLVIFFSATGICLYLTHLKCHLFDYVPL